RTATPIQAMMIDPRPKNSPCDDRIPLANRTTAVQRTAATVPRTAKTITESTPSPSDYTDQISRLRKPRSWLDIGRRPCTALSIASACGGPDRLLSTFQSRDLVRDDNPPSP